MSLESRGSANLKGELLVGVLEAVIYGGFVSLSYRLFRLIPNELLAARVHWLRTWPEWDRMMTACLFATGVMTGLFARGFLARLTIGTLGLPLAVMIGEAITPIIDGNPRQTWITEFRPIAWLAEMPPAYILWFVLSHMGSVLVEVWGTVMYCWLRARLLHKFGLPQFVPTTMAPRALRLGIGWPLLGVCAVCVGAIAFAGWRARHSQ